MLKNAENFLYTLDYAKDSLEALKRWTEFETTQTPPLRPVTRAAATYVRQLENLLFKERFEGEKLRF